MSDTLDPRAGEAAALLEVIAEDAQKRDDSATWSMASVMAEKLRATYASPQPANPAQVTEAMVERILVDALSWEPSEGGPSYKTTKARLLSELTVAIGAGGQAVESRKCAICGGPHDNDLLSDICQDCESSAPWCEDTHPAPSGQAVEPRKGFPVLGSGGQKVDWQLVADHGEQAQANHYQSIEMLAARGGLAWTELYAVLHDTKWQKMAENEAIVACRALEARYLSALSQPHPADERVVEALREAQDWISNNIREGDIAGCSLLAKLAALAQEGQ